MVMSDPIADMLTRIRNGGKAKLDSVEMPGSTIKIELAKVLKKQGYIKNFKFVKDDKQGILRVYLKYDANKSHAIYKLDRISKPSRRVYVRHKEVKPGFSGMGVAILSTSRGILTDKEARLQKVGGEVLCNIW